MLVAQQREEIEYTYTKHIYSQEEHLNWLTKICFHKDDTKCIVCAQAKQTITVELQPQKLDPFKAFLRLNYAVLLRATLIIYFAWFKKRKTTI